jgi:tRNA(Phe) wybutosine-synthesizing methylase Tyw3
LSLQRSILNAKNGKVFIIYLMNKNEDVLTTTPCPGRIRSYKKLGQFSATPGFKYEDFKPGANPALYVVGWSVLK